MASELLRKLLLEGFDVGVPVQVAPCRIVSSAPSPAARLMALVSASARASTALRRFCVGGAGPLRGAVLSDLDGFGPSEASEALLRRMWAALCLSRLL